MRSIETIVLARAAAIVLVVANHAMSGFSLHGGLNALLIISGLSLAQFGFGRTTTEALRAMARIGLRLAVPSFLLALATQIGVGRISAPELLFYSNWLYKSRVALFPIWYAQALSQMLVFLGGLFLMADMGTRIARRPLFWIGLLYGITCGAALFSYAMWDTSYLADKLPHLILWNFVFGWLIWAVRVSLPSVPGRLLLTGILGISILAIFLCTNANNGHTRALLVPLIILPLIWFDRISLPVILARAAIVTSQATLYIFLFHYYAFWAAWRVGRITGFEAESQNPLLRVILGVFVPVALWAFCTAALRVYRRSYRLWPPNYSAIRTLGAVQPDCAGMQSPVPNRLD